MNKVNIENGPKSSFGNDPAIQTKDPRHIEIKYKADFHSLSWCGDAPRRYFYVLENGHEVNSPSAFYCIPANCCCTGTDNIYKSYFDRGFFDQQNCYWKIGYYKGDPFIFPNNIKHVCCCIDCCDCYNQYTNMYCPCCCGDRISIVPAEYYCWCCPYRACWCHNCFSLCGPKNGEPLMMFPVAWCLKMGDAENVSKAFLDARTDWKSNMAFRA